MTRFRQGLEWTVHEVLFPRGFRRALWPELALGVLVGLIVVERGPVAVLALGLAIAAALVVCACPSRLMLSLFIVYMVCAHMYQSYYMVHFGGVVWHLRELLLMGLLAHWAARFIQGKAQWRHDPVHLVFLLLALFIVQIAFVGLFYEPDPHRIIAECRYPIFLLCYPAFITLVRDRRDLEYYMRLVLGVALVIALMAIFFFCYTFVTGNVINVQIMLGEFVQRRIGSRLIQEVRPSGHMYFEICAVVLMSLLFCPGIGTGRRLLYAGCLGVFLIAILFTVMRTAYASFAASVAFLLFLAVPNRRIQAVAGLACVSAGLLLLLFCGADLMDYVKEAMPGMGASIKGRLVEVSGAWNTFLEHSILGAGMGSRFEGMGFVARTSSLAYAPTTYATVHNVWMYYLFKGGAVGVLLVGLALGGLLARGYVLIGAMQDIHDRCLVRGLVAALGGQYIAALAMPRLTYAKGYVFLAMMGCCFVILAEWVGEGGGASQAAP